MSLKSVSSNVIPGALAFPAMAHRCLETQFLYMKMSNPTTESAAVCLKRLQKHNSLCLGHNVDHLVLSRIVQNF